MASAGDRIDQLDQLVALGLSLVPMRSGTKVPLAKWGHGGCEYRLLAEAVAAEPPANVAVVTGAASGGLLVVDADRHGGADGCEAMSSWEREHGRLPVTTTVLTPHGGVHVWFRVGAVGGLGDATRPDLGVDLRCGGLALVPPSVIDGVPYRYADGRSPMDVGIAEADDNVGALVGALRARAARRAQAGRVPTAVPEGGRNDSLFRYCCHVREMGGDETDVYLAATHFNSVLCRPPLPEGEVARAAASACRYPRGENGFAAASMLPDPGVPGGVGHE